MMPLGKIQRCLLSDVIRQISIRSPLRRNGMTQTCAIVLGGVSIATAFAHGVHRLSVDRVFHPLEGAAIRTTIDEYILAGEVSGLSATQVGAELPEFIGIAKSRSGDLLEPYLPRIVIEQLS
jgi:hypothetical protein